MLLVDKEGAAPPDEGQVQLERYFPVACDFRSLHGSQKEKKISISP